ncbi:Transport protein particle subunit trs23 [Smittium culicis]|uniref:Trafficking protein particle complex subunit n=1 Tax=Smittium culicis TaxID=133412 RepID=A0A1R1YIJ0_9FUNG|nr:Transport protein particle subunit trs23 [Smittium culicis]OMJ27223.1 Transport protein particle subunit trs23 [Smittium culicis]
MIYSLYIINKAGGLVYNKSFAEGLNSLSSNEALIFAGTFHGVHAISSQITPSAAVTFNPNGEPETTGISLIEAEGLFLHCFQTPTGVLFILITDPSQNNSNFVLTKIYELYSDYVLKNPFHTIDMPIRSEMFDITIRNLIRAN